MRYRELGNTGIKVSEIGVGCEGFLGKTPSEYMEMADAMVELGINCIDMYTSDPSFRKNFGAAIKSRREKFVLEGHICSVWEDGQYCRTRDLEKVKAGLEDQLELLDTDYLDIGMIHYCDAVSDWDTIVKNGILDYAVTLKENGTIRAIGLSSHNPEAALRAIATGKIDVLLFSVNPCYDLLPGDEDVEQLWNDDNYAKHPVNMDPQRQKLYEVCQAEGIGITVMKPFGGGDLLSDELSPAGKALTVNQCLHYALTRPSVAAVMCGAHSVEEMRKNASYEEASEEERDYGAALSALPKVSWEGHCMYCGHCAPCPMGISVADVTKFLNLTIAQGMVPETVREHYKVLEHKASECVSCGSCEDRCPFHVSVIENMEKAAEVFGE